MILFSTLGFILILSAIVCGIKTRNFEDVWLVIVIGVSAALFVSIIAAAFFPAEVIDIKEYPIQVAGKSLYYIDDNNEMHQISKDRENVIESETEIPIIRFTEYDNFYILKRPDIEIILPKQYIEDYL